MSWLAGVDGCRAGWFRVCRNSETRELHFDLLDTVERVFDTTPAPETVALDMPIGLLDSGRRDCDVAARKLLGPRRASVFSAPIRPALRSSSRAEADAISRRVDGKGVSAQAFGIYAKVDEVDRYLSADPVAQAVFCEVHPELSFRAWNEGEPMPASKKTAEGLAARTRLAEDWLGEGIVDRARDGRRKKDLADDDILDAIATLWTAHRISAGKSRSLPAEPPADRLGLPMRIVF